MSEVIGHTVPLKSLFQPIGGVLPAGVVAYDSIDATAQAFTNLQAIRWDQSDGKLNKQGQRWIHTDWTADPNKGCLNAATSRGAFGSRAPHVTEFEFQFTGKKLTFAFWGSSDPRADCQVYVEHFGKMYKIADKPKGDNTSGARFRNIEFAEWFSGRIRFVLGGGLFVNVATEFNSIISPSPDRHFVIADGDSFIEGIHAFNPGSDESYCVGGILDVLFELTGFVFGRRAQGGTGFFNNGGGARVTSDVATILNTTRFFSQDRRNWQDADWPLKPLLYLLNGTWNDGPNSGGTTASESEMYARALEGYQWVRSKDEYTTLIHVGIEPYTSNGAAGTPAGPPTAGNAHDVNRQGQQRAIAEVPRAYYVNPFGPDKPWFTGTGSNNIPAESPQAQLTGADGIHGNYRGYQSYARRIAAAIADIPVPAVRAFRKG